MTDDLQSMSDWLYSNLLGVQVEWPEHQEILTFNGLWKCERCQKVEDDDNQGKLKPPCHPTLPLLSAPEQYWRVIEAMREKGWESAMTQYTDNAIAQFHWNEGSGWFEDYLGGDTIGEAIIRASAMALGYTDYVQVEDVITP